MQKHTEKLSNTELTIPYNIRIYTSQYNRHVYLNNIKYIKFLPLPNPVRADFQVSTTQDTYFQHTENHVANFQLGIPQ